MKARLVRMRRMKKPTSQLRPQIDIGKNEYKLQNDPCKNCGKQTDGGTAIVKDSATERKPRRGDITVCLYCGHIMVYADRRGRKRELTDAEMVMIAGDPGIVTFNNIRGPALAGLERDRILVLIDRAIKSR